MNKPHISIPKPCHENWDGMHPREQGRHCDACDKTVIDFTDKSEKEIGEYFSEHADKRICGHFRKSQLHEKTSRLHAFLLQLHETATHNIKRQAIRAVALFFIGIMMSMTGCSPKQAVQESLMLGSVEPPHFMFRDSNDYMLEGEAQVEYGSSDTLGAHSSDTLGVQESSGGAASQ